MSGKTGIEWTDSTLVTDGPLQSHTINHLIAQRLPGGDQPFLQVAIILGTIAGGAGWNHIPRHGLAAFADRYDMVPGCRRMTAVRTPIAKLIQDCIHALCWHRGDRATACMYALPPLPSVFRVARITHPKLHVLVGATDTAAKLNSGLPLTAPTTPSQPLRPMQTSLSCGWTDATTCRVAGRATSFQPIPARAVSHKVRVWSPGRAFIAPLLASLKMLAILPNRDTKSNSSAFDRAFLCLGHLLTCLSVL